MAGEEGREGYAEGRDTQRGGIRRGEGYAEGRDTQRGRKEGINHRLLIRALRYRPPRLLLTNERAVLAVSVCNSTMCIQERKTF